MRILVGRTFGIGNAVLSIPMIKALSTLGKVDLLIGTTTDDFGADDVLTRLRGKYVDLIWEGQADLSVRYDVAIMAIPFDGRWHNGIHFQADAVMDCRKRPDNVERLGFDMWKKHEALYALDNAIELGYDGPVPDASFLPARVQDPELVYLGLGYKRDPGGFGLSKHFGNQRYGALVDAVLKLRPSARFVSTGGPTDVMQVGYQIHRFRTLPPDGKFNIHCFGLHTSFETLSQCGSYIGNDTGMMHVAASTGMPTFGMFAYPDLMVKNPPFCERSQSLLFAADSPSVEEVAEKFVQFVWG